MEVNSKKKETDQIRSDPEKKKTMQATLPPVSNTNSNATQMQI
jgi:hypothetical protein